MVSRAGQETLHPLALGRRRAANSAGAATSPLPSATPSCEMKFSSGISLAATFEGEFSDVTRSYAGKGVVRYQW
ncbi:MAG: Outer rane autotransporter barrel [Tardiphaga sp.]|nr:Outer rane autotransporter barrel [Tardiphaga sp.]